MKDFFKSLFTDGEWDGDPVKVFGILLILCGVVGFFISIPEWQWMIGFGASLVATGKFSIKG